MTTQHKIVSSVLFIITVSFLVSQAHAYGFGFLKNAAVNAFNDEDLALMNHAITYTLDEQLDQEIYTWSNPKTGHGGAVTALDSFEENGKECRRLRIINRSRNAEGRSTFTFCKMPDGTWLVKPKNPAATTTKPKTPAEE